MFGYIRPNVSELRVREHAAYKAVYCGLCATGGKRVSWLTRFLLSYDFVFLAMLRFCLNDDTVTLEKKRCVCFPPKKSPMVGECETLVYCSCAFAVLTYYKILDDVNDGKGIKRFFSRIALWFASPMKRRAVKKYPALDGIVSKPLAELNELEKSGETCIDRVADCFARMLSDVASFGLEGDNARIAANCGYHTGRFIYIADALDDIEDDAASGSYNAILLAEGSPGAATANREKYGLTLGDSMNAFMLAFGLSDASGDDAMRVMMREIIGNTAYYVTESTIANSGKAPKRKVNK